MKKTRKKVNAVTVADDIFKAMRQTWSNNVHTVMQRGSVLKFKTDSGDTFKCRITKE